MKTTMRQTLLLAGLLALSSGVWAAAAQADDAADLQAAAGRALDAQAKSDYPEAARQYERMLAISGRLYGAEAEFTGAVLNDLASLYDDMSEYARAEPLYLRCLKIREARLGADHLDFAASQNNLAELYRHMGRYSQAEPLYLHSLKIREARLGPNAPDVAGSLNNLGILYMAIGRYAEGKSLLERCLKIREAEPGGNPLEVARVLNNLAIMYEYLGQYVPAEAAYKRSLALREAQLGGDNPDVAQSLNNLAYFYRTMGRYAAAEPLFQRSLKIREAKLGSEHPDVAESLSNLGYLYLEMGKPKDDVEKFFQRSLKIREARLGPDHPDVAASLHDLAELYRREDRNAEAEKLALRALKIREAVLGPDHIDLAATLNLLALVYDDWNRADKQAGPLYERVLKIRLAKLGPDHPQVIQSLINLALFHAGSRQPAAAADEFDRARRTVRRYLANVLPNLGEREQLDFLNSTDHKNLRVALSLGMRNPGDRKIVERSAGWLANGKAVGQQALAEHASLARDAADPQLAPIVRQLRDVRAQLATLASSAGQPSQDAERQQKLADLKAQEQSLAAKIRSADGQAAPDDPWVELAAIRKALPEDAVLIDIARFHPEKFEVKGTAKHFDPSHYVAWVVPPADKGDVQVIDLGEAAPIDAAVEEYQREMGNAQTGKTIREVGEAQAEKLLQQPLSKLTKLVLEPLAPRIKDVKELVLSPDAGLWLVPWAALPLTPALGHDDAAKAPPAHDAAAAHYAIEKWKLRYVIAGREVALEKLVTDAQKPGPPRIFANPDYDLSYRDALVAFQDVFRQNNAAAPNPVSPATARPEWTQLASRSASTLGKARPLPGTAQEAADIAPKLKAYAGAEPRLYLDKQAQEGIFKRLRSPRVLVMSTHGFFLAAQQAPGDDELLKGGSEKPLANVDKDGRPLENPLLRCGLLLAGCNQRGSFDTNLFDDGILTGMEIVGVDLRGTDLVVLSACETGLGQVNNGEGVAGLRQAFQLAGARAVVSTLWQIPDLETAELMNDFFDALAGGKAKADALRDAQLKMIAARRAKSEAAHPLYWAAFTLTGQ